MFFLYLFSILNKSISTFSIVCTVRCHFHAFNLIFLGFIKCSIKTQKENLAIFHFSLWICTLLCFHFEFLFFVNFSFEISKITCKQFDAVFFSSTRCDLIKHQFSPTKHCFRSNINGSCEWTLNSTSEKLNEVKQSWNDGVCSCAVVFIIDMCRNQLVCGTHTLVREPLDST